MERIQEFKEFRSSSNIPEGHLRKNSWTIPERRKYSKAGAEIWLAGASDDELGLILVTRGAFFTAISEQAGLSKECYKRKILLRLLSNASKTQDLKTSGDAGREECCGLSS
jgi:hypothetical protein